MRKSFAVILLATSLLALQLPQSWAQEEASSGVVSDELSNDMANEELATEESEAAPEPEFPYPGAKEADLAQPQPTPAPLPLNLPKPIRINEETGTYYYGTDLEETKYEGNYELTRPADTSKKGDFYYGTSDESQEPPTKMEGNERPISISKKGEYRYQTEVSPRLGTATVRFGTMQPPDITNKNNGITFEELYGSEDIPVLLADYEWRYISSLGQIGIKLISGLATSNGQGRFANPARSAELPEEVYSFFIFPNQLTAIYRFQYADEQVLVPYIEGGAGYYTFVEMRDDSADTKLGGALVTVAAGGAQFLLDWLDRRAVRALDQQWGINHVWLTAEYRMVLGGNPNFDFSSQILNAGLLFDF